MTTTTQDSAGAALRAFMIADIRGYTRFTREHGDAAAARLAARFADLARDAVEARGGEVLELRGDEALAVFDSTVPAVRAAIEFQALCAEEFGEDPTLPLAVGIGIDVGQAVPVEGGFRGVALNMAARLCSNAAAGQVLVSRAVADSVSDAEGVRFESRGDTALKGFEGAVPLIEALDELPSAPPVPATATAPGDALAPELDPMTPLADRVREMRWLRGTWRQARRGRGRLIWISGPSQIGKTRLIAELASMVHTAGGHVSYAGLGGTADAEALRAIRGITDHAQPALLVVDDVDAMGDEVARELEERLDTIAVRPVLVVATIRAPDVSPSIERVLRRSDPSGDGLRRLAPLDADGVRQIAGDYVDVAVNEVPLEAFVRASGGIPGRVHEVVGEWAREEAGRRLTAAAEWLSEGRARRNADIAFANNVIGLKLGRLYAPAEGDDRSVCPYKGLATFEEGDAAFFFGRERLVGDLAARTVGAGLLGVVGASGSGKSSLVFAGLLPSLRAGLLPGSERWRAVTMRPGEHPLAELQGALAGTSIPGSPAEAVRSVPPEERLVLVVDQFEEIFTTCEDEDERGRSVAAICGIAKSAPDRVVVVLTIRGDYYGHCARYPDLAELLAANHVLVGSMTREELRRAIELPARRVGLRVESALTDMLVEEIADQPGALPLLSTALVELWQESQARWLRLETYERTGGVRGAVARIADSSFHQLSDAQQEAARAIFLRLVAAGEAEGVARRRVRLDEFDLERDPAVAVALTQLTGDRLLTMDESTVEVSHEALLREWPRLQGWLEEDATGRQLRQHVTSAARQWQAAGRDESELYRGARLSAALDWSSGHERELNEVERDFLSTSRRASEREAERQRRVNRRLRGSLVGVALLLAIAIVAGSLALIQRGQARDAASRAARSAVTADAQRIGALALLEDQPDLALLLAVQGAALDPGPPETRGSLFEALMRFPRVLRVLPVPERILRMATSRAGDVLTVADNTGRVFVYAVPSFEPIFEGTLGGGVNQLAMAPDGRRLVASVSEEDVSQTRILALDVPSGARAWSATVPTADFGTGRLSVSPDGTEAVWVSRGAVRFLDLGSGRPSRPPVTVKGESAWMLDRHRLLTMDDDRGARIMDLRSGTLTREIELRGPRGGAQALSPDGSMLALGGHDGTVEVLALESGELVRMREAHDGFVEAMVFSPDGSVLATAGEDGHVFLWDPATGVRTDDLVGHSSGLRAAVFAERGATLVTGGLDSTVIAWDVAGDRAMLRTFDRPGPPCSDVCPFPMFAVTADGRFLAIPGTDLRVRFIDTMTLRPAGALEEPGLACCQVPGSSPDGSKIVTVFGLAEAGFPGPNAVSLWDVGSGALLRRLYTSDEPWTDVERAPPLDTVAYAPDGSSVATNENERILLLHPDTGETLARYEAPAFVQWLSYSPDGRFLQADMDGGLVAVWDLHTDRLLWSRKVDDQLPLGGEFAADGGSLIVGSESGKIHLLDPRTGRQLREPLLAHDAYLASITIHPDSTMFATSGTDGLTFLWDARTQRALGSPFGGSGEGGAWSRFSPDGRLLYVSSSEGGSVFDTTLEGWIDRACAIAGRTLTRAEWYRFLPDRPYRPACSD